MTALIPWLRRLASPRSPGSGSSPGQTAAALLLRVASAALLAWIGYIHLHLWQEGYRFIPTNGPLFLLDAIAAFVLAAALLAWPRPLAGLVAAGYTVSTLGALVISLTVGLFGFRESINASYVTESIIIEAVTVIVLIAWTVLAASRLGQPRQAPAAGSAASRLSRSR
jgi:hypothetical protein